MLFEAKYSILRTPPMKQPPYTSPEHCSTLSPAQLWRWSNDNGKTSRQTFWCSRDSQSYTSKGIWRQGIGSFVRNSCVSTRCPVVMCPYLCTSEISNGKTPKRIFARRGLRMCHCVCAYYGFTVRVLYLSISLSLYIYIYVLQCIWIWGSRPSIWRLLNLMMRIDFAMQSGMLLAPVFRREYTKHIFTFVKSLSYGSIRYSTYPELERTFEEAQHEGSQD